MDFQVALLRNNPMYVRDSLVMANYDQKEYLRRIISDSLQDQVQDSEYSIKNDHSKHIDNGWKLKIQFKYRLEKANSLRIKAICLFLYNILVENKKNIPKLHKKIPVLQGGLFFKIKDVYWVYECKFL